VDDAVLSGLLRGSPCRVKCSVGRRYGIAICHCVELQKVVFACKEGVKGLLRTVSVTV
jgi:hypothetical protein